eukprot:1350292-Lingulodinium_polyedra.AAC.1
MPCRSAPRRATPRRATPPRHPGSTFGPRLGRVRGAFGGRAIFLCRRRCQVAAVVRGELRR